MPDDYKSNQCKKSNKCNDHLFNKGIVKGLYDQRDDCNKKGFANKGIPMFNGKFTANLPANKVGTGHKNSKFPVHVSHI